MGYVEFLRARHAFIVFAIIIIACVALVDLSIAFALQNAFQSGAQHAHGTSYSISVGSGTHPNIADAHFTIPIGLLFGLAAFSAIVLATILATSLNLENGRGGFAFTKPIGRERLALTYFAIDLGAMAATFALTLLVELVSLAAFGILGKIVAEPGAFSVVTAGLGTALMYYGLLQAATAMRVAGGRMIAGLSWVFFVAMLGFYSITYLGPIFHGLIAFIDFFNPLGYYMLRGSNDGVTVESILGFDPQTSTALTWALGIASCGAAVYAWKRVEA